MLRYIAISAALVGTLTLSACSGVPMATGDVSVSGAASTAPSAPVDNTSIDASVGQVIALPVTLAPNETSRVTITALDGGLKPILAVANGATPGNAIVSKGFKYDGTQPAYRALRAGDATVAVSAVLADGTKARSVTLTVHVS